MHTEMCLLMLGSLVFLGVKVDDRQQVAQPHGQS